jgi:hypothetical protein
MSVVALYPLKGSREIVDRSAGAARDEHAAFQGIDARDSRIVEPTRSFDGRRRTIFGS